MLLTRYRLPTHCTVYCSVSVRYVASLRCRLRPPCDVVTLRAFSGSICHCKLSTRRIRGTARWATLLTYSAAWRCAGLTGNVHGTPYNVSLLGCAAAKPLDVLTYRRASATHFSAIVRFIMHHIFRLIADPAIIPACHQRTLCLPALAAVSSVTYYA